MEKIGCLTINGTESLEGYFSTDSGKSSYKDFEIVKGVDITDQNKYATYLNFYDKGSTDPTTQLYSTGLITNTINCDTINAENTMSCITLNSTNIIVGDIQVSDAEGSGNLTAKTITSNNLNIGNVGITEYNASSTTNTISITGTVTQNSNSSYTVSFSQALLQSYSFTFYYTIYAWLFGFKVSSTHTLNVTVGAGEKSKDITISVSSGNGISAYGVGSSFAKSFTFTQTNTNYEPSIKVAGNIYPSEAGTYDLGSANNRWNIMYYTTGAVGTSDRKLKNNIKILDDKYYELFDKLIPVSYKFNQNTSDRTHTGFIAQDVKQAIEEVGLTTQDVAAYCEWENEDGEIGCGLRYSELIALAVGKIQQLEEKIKNLEEKLLTP